MQSLRIRELEIRNFRGIECSQLQFDDANILVGNNGSGKTATLAAIARLLPAMRQETRLFLDADFRMDESWTAQTITLNCKIEIDDQEIDLEVSGNRKNTGSRSASKSDPPGQRKSRAYTLNRRRNRVKHTRRFTCRLQMSAPQCGYVRSSVRASNLISEYRLF